MLSETRFMQSLDDTPSKLIYSARNTSEYFIPLEFTASQREDTPCQFKKSRACRVRNAILKKIFLEWVNHGYADMLSFQEQITHFFWNYH